ncbi:hypothetical protein ABID08_001145 [Rhizobium binae]|uniref:Uncharacterized protein n=1 Tax=Rhizobium binae TaxID=1138190 RepID=A0ABV2MBG3_9HYPH|nr:hypothetical protein [Rhizobium binae]MBX4990106.1 hypothetical protein [Rhizobium binae]NKL48229.1 hypothetical protein [Rhizobium leguminosarum bv. viciae]QSY82807.1 hypothetical protein J2J99_03005 [Rhizobium binae]
MMIWLSEQGISFPALPSRWPTGSEVKRALSDLDLTAEITDNGAMAPWHALVRDAADNPDIKWALLIIPDYSGDHEPQKLYFEKGHEPLIRRILSHIALACGPLVLINDADSFPEIIGADA